MTINIDVTAVERLRQQLLSEQAATPHMFRELANIESLLADTYRDRVSYELLQNSDDAGSKAVKIQIAADSIEWENDGRPLTVADVTALCRSATSTKTRGETIGYRGIGFKSVASIAHSVTVASAGVTFTFDRELTARELRVDDPAAVPMIRVPSSVRPSPWAPGVRFSLELNNSATFSEPDPLAMLFLRNVQRIAITESSRVRLSTVTRSQVGSCVLTVDGRRAAFALLSAGEVSVAVPLDESALAMVGSRGRLACFLPLEDQVGLPFIISGDVLTDPSRTHAVPQDPSTLGVLSTAAQMIAAGLANPHHSQFDRMWELLLLAPDTRAELVTPRPTVSSSFLTGLRNELKANPPSFAVTPVELEPSDVVTLFPAGAPQALYRPENLGAAKLLRTALGLTGMEASDISRAASASALTPHTRRVVAERLIAIAEATRTKLAAQEQEFVARAGVHAPRGRDPQPPRPLPRAPERATFPTLMAQWRLAEKAVAEWLNSKGWQLADVSTQNLGYDLYGTDDQGAPVHVEVKKVDQPTSRFTVTTNEMATMQSSRSRYLLAVVVAAGEYSQLMLLDPNVSDIPYDKVCRQWQYEFYDWARHGEWVR